MARPAGAVRGVDRAEVQVAAERGRATRSGDLAARHENLAASGPDGLRQFHRDAAKAHRRMQERHLVSAGIHAAHLARLRAAEHRAMRSATPGDALPELEPLDPTTEGRYRTAHDQVTDLPNRRMFAERLALAAEGDAQGRHRRIAVCLVDVDFFGAVNDRFGRRAGDSVLGTLARRLVECAPSGFVARLGGDEFGVLLEDMASWGEATALADRLIAAIVEPISVNGDQVSVSASIGVARGNADGIDAAELLRSANVSLGWAKEGGRRRWEVFDSERDKEATARSALAADLPAAIERGEFNVVYQPIASLTDGHIVGAEALVRWRHPIHGMLGPGQFIGLAEERGLIGQIGAIVLAQACGEAVRWRQVTPIEFFMSVNITASQLDDPGLVRQVTSVLDETGLPAYALHLEILEGAVVKASGPSVPALHRLADLGVFIAIDDFGTGYSNLSYLRRLPVKIIKTDRSFITDLCPPDQGPDDTGTEIFSTIVSLAHVLGLTVIAEGVEAAVQADWLRSMGVEAAQGWYFGRPVPAEEMAAVIDSDAQRIREPVLRTSSQGA